MKKLSLALIAISLSLVSIGQTAKKTTKAKKTTPKTEKIVEKPTSKIEKAGLTWYTDLAEASELAKKENKTLMLFFTGSDWCGWCKRLEADVFTKPEFKEWSDKEVIMLVLDFPRASILSEAQKTQNMKLQQQFAIRGYPTVVLTKVDKENLNLTELGRTGWMGSAPEWVKNANSILGK